MLTPAEKQRAYRDRQREKVEAAARLKEETDALVATVEAQSAALVRAHTALRAILVKLDLYSKPVTTEVKRLAREGLGEEGK